MHWPDSTTFDNSIATPEITVRDAGDVGPTVNPAMCAIRQVLSQSGDERAEYGKRVISDLSAKLTQRYGSGYSAANLWLFRQFYQVFQEREPLILDTAGRESGSAPRVILDALRRESSTPGETPFHPQISWSHYRALMRVEKPHARDFYETEPIAAGWNTRELERQIHSLYYERLLLSKDKQGMIHEQRTASPGFDPAAILKSSTVLEFLGLPDHPRLHESRLEQAIMDNLQTFLLELGRGFSFVARQRRLLFGDEGGFYVDLVFYNYLLKCFVLIDLKIGKLTHQDIGQMDGYVRMYEDLYKVAEDTPEYGRSPAFRRKILAIYDHQCAACGLRIKLPAGNDVSFIDAAHLIPFSESQNDHPTNGLALCKNHHWAMDSKLIAPCTDHFWHVSKILDPRRSNGEKELLELSGKSLLLPQDQAFHPDDSGLSYRLERLIA